MKYLHCSDVGEFGCWLEATAGREADGDRRNPDIGLSAGAQEPHVEEHCISQNNRAVIMTASLLNEDLSIKGPRTLSEDVEVDV